MKEKTLGWLLIKKSLLADETLDITKKLLVYLIKLKSIKLIKSR